MKKLKIEHIVGYRSKNKEFYLWDIDSKTKEKGSKYNLISLFFIVEDKTLLPLLIPMDRITKEISDNGVSFVPIDVLRNEFEGVIFHDSGTFEIKSNLDSFCFFELLEKIIERLCDWRFDVFNLIPAGYAIDIDSIDLQIETKTNTNIQNSLF